MNRQIAERDQCRKCVCRPNSAFNALGEHDLFEIDRIRSLVQFCSGANVPLKFENEEGFYCIRRGHLKLEVDRSKDTRTVRICGPGDLVGFDSDGTRKHVVTALEDGTACFFSWGTFQNLLMSSTQVCSGVIKMLCKIIALNNRRIAALQNSSVRSRVAALLLSLDSKFGDHSSPSSKIDVRIDRKTLAGLAGTAVENLSRMLTEFEQEGAIIRDGRDIRIANKSVLEKLVIS
ncbi:MAG: Crp/Fnr family transcriptional regulator [Bacteriovoracia bacterium]